MWRRMVVLSVLVTGGVSGWLAHRQRLCFVAKPKVKMVGGGRGQMGMRKLDGLTKDRLLSSFVLDLFRNGGGQNERKSGG
jgi:hypothetical protein